MTDTQVTWLTEESYDRLKAELDQLIANRPVIAAEINDRREEGDLRENGGYHAAREEQGQQEARFASIVLFLFASCRVFTCKFLTPGRRGVTLHPTRLYSEFF